MPPLELHLLICSVNSLHDGLEVWPRSEDWLKLCNVKKVKYHMGKFEGNNSRSLLKKADQLEGLCPSNNMVKKVANAFKALNDVVAACYGYELTADYVTKIKKFSRAYIDLGINGTPKVHTVMHNVQEFFVLTCRGLGPRSEQANESVHHEFKQKWRQAIPKMNCMVSIFWKQYRCITATTYEHFVQIIIQTIRLIHFKEYTIFVRPSFISALCFFVSHSNL